MRHRLNRLVVAFLVVTLASAAALAKGHKATITLKSDTRFGEVLVEKGTYDVKFDDQSSELSIWKGKKEIAKSAVQLETRPTTAWGTEHVVREENNEDKLVSITFRGTNQNVVLKPANTQATINK